MTTSAPLVCITMAGQSSRFSRAGYRVPKYRLSVHGSTLLDYSLRSIRPFLADEAEVVFVSLAEHDAEGFVAETAEAHGLAHYRQVLLPGATDGQASTVAAGLQGVGPDRPLLVWNVDTFVRPGALDAAAWRPGAGYLPCFRVPGDHWSFAAVEGPERRVTRVAEKERISEFATIGLYGFPSTAGFLEARARAAASGTDRSAGERYVAPLYNTLRDSGVDTYVAEVPAEAVVPLGTPEELTAYAEAVA